jgi:outer membrane protein assembly factor BamE (lipoprotein component of BamABCDE complex)
MDSNKNTIIEGVGLSELKFGMEKEKVASIMGEPEEKELYTYSEGDDDQTEDWHYDELELSLGFDQTDKWRLGAISITSDNYKFRDFSPIGLSKEEFTKKMKENEINDLELEESSSEGNTSHELLSSPSMGINFWFENGVLQEIQWGPFFTNEGIIQWPK